MIKEAYQQSQQFLRAAETRVSRNAIFLASITGPFEASLREQKDGNIQKLNQLFEEGYGVVFVLPHFSLRDVYAALPALGLEVPAIGNRPMVYPIAQHIYEKPGFKQTLKLISHFTNGVLAQITTRETKEIEAEYERLGKTLPWEKHEVGTGNLAYGRAAEKVLKNNGFVVIAPQGTRQPHLSEFESRPIEILMRLPGKREKIAVCVMGLEIPGATDYAKDAVGGLNPGKKYKTTVGFVGTREELTAQAKLHEWSIDQEVLWLMNEVAPEAYKARDKQGNLIFP